ncbi:MAG: hybrid sensor histidine kinase/response regulator, partial [Gammaproteobacteria bacterium]|nr:hybrid sensor histidine kinase/response regulator [Gemmatimonadota bacterium]NIU75744.1 hybrid sensor histidine kinase/response regulator [Gammaproteobacteria bacterium]
TVDLRNVVRHLQVMLRRIIGEHVALHMDLGDEPLWVRIDTGQLEQVLVNLAVNARDAMPDGGNMRIETRKTRLGSNQRNDLPDDSYARLSVGDEGHGIPE